MKRFGSLLAFAAVLVVTAISVAHAVGSSAKDVPFTAEANCNGETVMFAGTSHQVFRLEPDNAGGFHFMFHQDFQNVTGVGTMATYRGQGTDNFSIYFRGVAPAISTFTSHLMAKPINNPLVPNFRVHMVFHVTVNANGDPTAAPFQMRCDN